jgi:hypothetical protein
MLLLLFEFLLILGQGAIDKVHRDLEFLADLGRLLLILEGLLNSLQLLL